MREMPRAPAVFTRDEKELIVEERRFRFLTPVFGGGVRVDGCKKPHDPITPVRVPSIRGQLRFWWRACNPRGLTTVAELSNVEAQVFGSTKVASPLVIDVVEQPATPRPKPVLQGRHGAVHGLEALAYGAFPLRGQVGEDHGVLWDHGDAPFSLRLRYPGTIKADVEAALWAWSSFGGLGGRTRRGFGAVEELGAGTNPLAVWQQHVSEVNAPWPHLSKTSNVVRSQDTFDEARSAHALLLSTLKNLRQGEGTGRKRGPETGAGPHPGRSYWPEADAIRALTGRPTNPGHPHARPVTATPAFPRAGFGLPMIFQFKDGADPGQSTLVPTGLGRLASALVLRPSRGPSGRYHGLALVLAHPAPTGHELRTQVGGPHSVRTTLTHGEARNLGIGGRPSPLEKNGTVHADPIQRFLEELR